MLALALALALASGLLVAGESACTMEDDAVAGPEPSRLAISSDIACDGAFVQGGAVVCRGTPGSSVELGGATTLADADGFFVLGFDRDSPPTEIARIRRPDGKLVQRVFRIQKRSYPISRIDGLPPSQVDRYSKADLEQIEASTKRKQEGDRSRAKLSAFREHFTWPVVGRQTSVFGAQRVLNGIEKRPHYGVDLAAPTGTPVQSPAEGVVSLADDDLYFEGSMIVIDHGQGFLSKYLHLSRIDVEPGQRVKRGEVIGAVGSRGRSTGPHLCWRLKWRDRNLDPALWLE
jgi:murein DD-endopeptidase MepM/ murein hydrolase activator NlpD